ncbi:MAG: hypothetical protein EP297_14070 [Gammaproteobacteria bacterium]|nr:MAG: hypothetical protein EP297_14070 [Gammaproteobacteria bacterium]
MKSQKPAAIGFSDQVASIIVNLVEQQEGGGAMPDHSCHIFTKAVLGFAVLFASGQAQGVVPGDPGLIETDVSPPTIDPGPYVEQVYVNIGPDDSVECYAIGVGYTQLNEEDNGGNGDVLSDEAILSSPYDIEPPSFSIYAFPEGKLPVQLNTFIFDEEALNLYGSASGEVTPLPTPVPQERAAILNTSTGAPFFMLLETPWNPDVHTDCTVFELVDQFEVDALTGEAVKRKVAKKKVAKANKRKVHKKATKRKATAKRRKATRKAAGM